MHNPGQLTILINGATDGLGQRVATDLAAKGVTLLLHGRDPDKGRQVLAKIREISGNSRLHYFNADLASLAEVDRLAASIGNSQPRLDVLINNAGLGVLCCVLGLGFGEAVEFAARKKPYISTLPELITSIDRIRGIPWKNATSS